jgi:hypothetical protein
MPNALVPEGVVAVALPSAVIATMLGARYKTYEAEAGYFVFNDRAHEGRCASVHVRDLVIHKKSADMQ